jgi:hypothetical protein
LVLKAEDGLKKQIEMSEREIERLRVLERVRDGSVRQRHAVAVLPLSDRQVRRLLRRYQREGAAL